MKKTELVFNIVLVLTDFIVIVAAGIAAYELRISPWLREWRQAGSFFEQFSFFQYLPIDIIVSVIWIMIFAVTGLYQSKINRGSFEDFLKIVIASLAALAATTMLFFFRKELFDSRFIIIAYWFLAIVLTALDRLIIRGIWRKYNLGLRNVVLLGDEQILKQVKYYLEENPYFCSRVVKEFIDFDIDFLKNNLQNVAFDEIIVCDPACSKEKIAAVADYCEEKQIDFRFVPDLYQAFFTNISIETIAGFPVLELKRTPLEGWGKFAKRAVDIAISLPGIILLSPVWLIIGVAIKIDSPGPAIVKFQRISRGQEFYLYKFRSMKDRSHGQKKQLAPINERSDGPFFKIKNDPRVTRIGRFLRETWLDEFPQLINVLKGEMSLVGPRPHEPDEIAHYEKYHKRTFFVKAGMTGLAQISGGSNLKFEEEIKFDLYYIKNWSLFWDFKILLKTAVLFFKKKDDGCYFEK